MALQSDDVVESRPPQIGPGSSKCGFVNVKPCQKRHSFQTPAISNGGIIPDIFPEIVIVEAQSLKPPGFPVNTRRCIYRHHGCFYQERSAATDGVDKTTPVLCDPGPPGDGQYRSGGGFPQHHIGTFKPISPLMKRPSRPVEINNGIPTVPSRFDANIRCFSIDKRTCTRLLSKTIHNRVFEFKSCIPWVFIPRHAGNTA